MSGENEEGFSTIQINQPMHTELRHKVFLLQCTSPFKEGSKLLQQFFFLFEESMNDGKKFMLSTLPYYVL